MKNIAHHRYINNQIASLKIGMRFASLMYAEIGRTKLNEADQKNAEQRNPSVCHSHDYCDANVIMQDAMDLMDGEISDEWDSAWNYWNSAWNFAKRSFVQMAELHEMHKQMSVHFPCSADAMLEDCVSDTLSYSAIASDIRSVYRHHEDRDTDLSLMLEEKRMLDLHDSMMQILIDIKNSPIKS